MSYYFLTMQDPTGREMVHAAVNTDPLQMLSEETKKTYYGLKVRNIPHTKISEMNELKVWYEFGNKIGEGGFGVVLAVTERSTSKNWAMKVISKSTVGERIKMVEQEIQILKLIQHPHIIYLDKIFESSKKIYLVFERCHRDFAKVYNERKPFAEKIAKKITSELVDAVAYLHKYDIVHRDVKMENILLGENPHDPTDEYYIKLTDFGLSVVKSGKGLESMLHDYCGTMLYMAPEMITSRSYSQMCDMWSIGVILFMLVTGRYPFFSKDDKELKLLICTQSPTFNDPKLTNEVKDLIVLLLIKDPVKRITATEVLQHPWIQGKKMSKAIPYNIMDKMKEWKSEMTVETGAASDWVVGPDDTLEPSRSRTKQVMNLPKTNINFDRGSRRNSNMKRNLPSKEQIIRPSSKQALRGQCVRKQSGAPAKKTAK